MEVHGNPRIQMIISLHLPKTAGTSFGEALSSHFGASFVKDYEDRPFVTDPEQRQQAALEARSKNADRDFGGVDCIHGHFLPVKYLGVAARSHVQFVTWLRDPVHRVLSHYYFWRRTYNPETSPALHRRVVEENWSLERFCLSSELRNFYGQFLWQFPISRFDFIGISERYSEDLEYFGQQFLGRRLKLLRLNVADDPGRADGTDDRLRNRIEEWNADDMALYRYACAKRGERPLP